MPSNIELGLLDIDPFTESATVSHGLVFSGALEMGKVERAWARMGKAWPLLGASVCLNNLSNKIEIVIPDANDVNLRATAQILDSKIAETERLHSRTNTISTQVCTRTEQLYRSKPPQTLQQHIASGDPIFALHTAYLQDATFITVTFPHLVDGCGYNSLINTLLLALDGQPIPPLLPHDPWSVLLPEARSTASDPEAVSPWMTWDKNVLSTFRQQLAEEYRANQPIQMRTVYFPAAEIARMREESAMELRKAGHEVHRLSTTDLIGAWFYKHAFDAGPGTESKSRFVYPFNARHKFPEAFIPNQPYLRNGFFTISTDQVTDAQLEAMSLGEIARMIRMSVTANSSRDSFLSKLKHTYKHADKFYIPVHPEDRLRIVSSWLSFRLSELSVANHIKPGTGTGEVLDVSGEAIGRHFVALIKHKDADGGVVCEMDWGAKRWLSGSIAKFAMENQS